MARYWVKWREYILKRHKNFIVLVLLLIVIIGSLVFVVVKNKTGTVKVDKEEKIAAKEFIGQTLPDFNLLDSQGGTFSSTTTVGKPTIVMDWASWCPHCQKMMPTMNKMYKKYKDDVNFVFINATGSNDGSETRDTARQYIEEKGYQFPYYYDDDMAVASLLKIEFIPTTFFIEKDGTVKDVTVSEMKTSKVDNKIKKMIKKP